MSNDHSPDVPRSWPRAHLLGLALLGMLTAAATAVVWLNQTPDSPPSPAPRADATTVARGAYLARVGNCAACHTARGGQAYAGGRGLPTPFGTVYAGNLTPDKDTGLGRWSVDDFWRALHHGRSRDGRLLTPAFPYTEFTQVSRDDSDALYVYLRSLPPVAQPATPNGLRFPFNTQAALAVWRALYFRPATPETPAVPGRSADWQRGAYLVRGLGHCAACHAARNGLGATQQADRLAGGALPLQPWFAPDLAPLNSVPLARQQQDLVDLLRTGMSSHSSASGPMAEVVVSSTQHWTDQDLRAAAVYLTSLQARQPPPPQPRPLDAVNAAQHARGLALYTHQCAQCHGARGDGSPGIYPPLAGNPSVTLADASNAMQVIRHGGFTPATRAHPRPFGMPPAGLNHQELADVTTYIRQSWGNQADAVTVLESMRAP